MTDVGVLATARPIPDGLLASHHDDPPQPPRIMRTRLTRRVSEVLAHPKKCPPNRCYPACDISDLSTDQLRALPVKGTVLEPIVAVLEGQEVPRNPTFDFVMVTFGLPYGAIKYLVTNTDGETILGEELAERWNSMLTISVEGILD